MTTVITRVYESTKQATDAVALLRTRRYASADIDSIGSDTPDVVGALVKAGVPGSSAKKYAEYVSRGCTAVVVRAPYGQSFPAIKALNDCKPLDVQIEAEHFDGTPALLSEVLGIPMLIKGEPTTSLIDDRTTSEWFRIPTTLGDRTLSELLHIPTISRMKPFSSLIDGTIGSKIGLPEILK